MNEPARRPTDDYSRDPRLADRRVEAERRPADPGLAPVQIAVLTAAVLGAVLLAAAEFTNVLEVKVGSSVVDEQSGGDRHSYALLLIAVVAFAMAYGAGLNGSRPAMAAIVGLGLIAAAIGVLGDAPDIDDTGVIGADYEAASASAATGFYLETLGAALMVVAGGVLLALTAPARLPAARGEPPARP